MPLLPNNFTTQCILFQIAESKSKLLNDQELLFCIFFKSEKYWFYISAANFDIFFWSSFYNESLT